MELNSHSRLRASPPASQGEQHSRNYLRVRGILVDYLSPILVDSVLEKAMRARNVSARTLGAVELGEVTSDIMLGLRLFVAEDRLPQLMLELAEVLEVEST